MKSNFYINRSASICRGVFTSFVVSMLLITNAMAQPGTPTYLNNTGATANGFPFNTTANIKIQWIYVPGAFTTLGGGSGAPAPGGMAISKIYIKFSSTVNATTVYPNFSIALGQNLGTQANWGTTSVTTYPFTTGLTTCFSQAAGFQFTGITAGAWYGITLQTPFVYDPSLSLIVEAKSTLTTAGGNGVANVTTTGQMQRLYGANAATTGTSNTGLTPLGFDLISTGACTNPVTAGTSTATPSTPVCTGTSVTLNLSGNTSGSGQTYQWFSDPVLGGSYSTAVSGVLTAPAFAISPSTTLYYRCVEICSAGTPVNSTPVQVTVTPGLSGVYTINSLAATGGTNFQTFTAAAAALSCGVSGPVVFNVSNGPYTEQVEIPVVGGTSAVNTVTFNGGNCTLTFAASVSTAPGTFILNGADFITVNNLNIIGTGGTYALTVHLWNGANNNTFSGCTISSPVTAGSTTQVPYSISGTATAYSGSGTSGNNNVVTGCTISGGYYGATLYSSTSAGLEALNNTISNNTIRDAYSYHVYILYQSGAIVSGNDISRPNKTTSTTTAGVYCSTGCIGTLIEKNRIHNVFDAFLTSTSTCYGVAVLADGTALLPTRVENNLIYDINGNGAAYGIYNSTGPNMLAYHNTIALNDQATTSGAAYGLYQTGATTGIDYKNNVVSITRSGTGIKRCIYFVSTTTGNASNNNDLYMNATGGTNNHVGQYVSTNYTLLTGAGGWQTANGGIYDGSSESTDPIFSNPGAGNYTPTTILLDNLGTGVGVTTDILGSARNGTTPDPGAYEFSVSAGMDIGAFSLVTPATSGCYTNVQTIVIKIKNYGSLVDFSATPATVTCDVTGTNTASLSATISSGTLAVNGTLDVTLTGTFDMSANGSYTFNSNTTAGSDGNTLNDAMTADSRTRSNISAGTLSTSLASFCLSATPLLTLTGNAGGDRQWQSSTISASGPWTNEGTGATTYSPTVSQTTYYQVETTCMAAVAQSNVITETANNPQITGTTPGSHCGTGTVTLSATPSGGTVNWYTASTGGSPISTGNSYTTPVISSNTTYYASASSGGFNGNVGKIAIETTAGTGGGLTTYVNFDAISNFTLQTVDLFPYGATNGAAGTVTIELRTSTGTPIMSQLVNVTACNSPTTCTAQTVSLNFPCVAGTSYRLGVNSWTGGVTNLYRDLTGTYPYTLAGVVSITGTSLAPYYYFFYNWGVSTGCESARTPVIASITSAPSITPSSTLETVCNGGSTNLNVSSSNPGYTYIWTPGNLPGASVSVNPTSNTTYTVTAVDNSAGTYDGCGQVATQEIIAQPASATVTASPSAICAASGSTTVSLTPASGYPAGTIQWQDSPNGTVYNNIGGANANTYSSPTLSSTTYYHALIMDGNSNICLQPSTSIVVGVPSVTNSTPATRCGTGTVTLNATPSAGASINWFANSTGGTSLASGNSFTPFISSTTTYYAEATTGGGASATTSLPAAGTPFSGNVRGYWFTSPVNFTITGLSTPYNGAGTPTAQSVAIIRFTGAVPPPTYSTTTNAFTTLFLSQNDANTGTIPCNVVINSGDVIGIFGHISVGATNYSAYATPVGALTTTIGGSTVTMTRMGMQFSLTSTAPQDVWQEPAAAIGRVAITYEVGCTGNSRTPVLATVTPAPPINVTSTYPAICPGGSTDLNVTSTNDPDYTYSWTSSPAGFTANTAGPHTVSPTVTTKYYLSAVDNSSGANQGCAMIDSVTVVNGGTLVPGTTSASQSTLCVSGTPILTATGSSGGALQWQQSTVSSSGPWTNVGTGTTTYNPGTVTQTTYYQMEVSCQTSSVTSNVTTVTVNNPQLTGTTPGSRCGPGTVALGATASTGTINWYANSSGGVPLATGNSYSPNVTSTTTYYAAATAGGGGLTSVGAPNNGQATGYTLEAGLFFDALTAFTLQGVYVYPVGTGAGTVDIAVKNSAAVNIYTTTVNLTGTAAPGIKTFVPLNWNIAVGTGYSLVMLQRTGLVASLVRDPAANITGGGFPFTLPGVLSITTGRCCPSATSTSYYYFYDWQVLTGCEGARTAVIATVNPAPAISVTPTQTTCSNVSETLTVTSPNDPDYTYTWNPGNLSGSSVTVSPTTTTTYTVNAVDNTAGPNSGCANIGTVLVNVDPAPAAPVMTPTSALLCEDDTVKLKASGQANVNATIGTQTSTTQVGMPFRAGNATAFRTQYLYTAAELTAAGLSAGNWTAFKWTVTTAIGAGATMGNLTIRVGNTAVSALTATFQPSPSTIVYGPFNYVASGSLGDITFSFATPFSWNGTSNVLIEICHDNPSPTGVSGQVASNTTAFVSTAAVGNVCGTAAGATTQSVRPIIKISGTTGGPVTWSPITDLYEDANLVTPYTGGLRDSVYSHPSITRTYTATTTLGSCPASSTVTVTVDVIPQVTITPSGVTSYCPGSSVTLNASTDPTYTNYAWTPGGPSGPGATSFTVGGATNSTITYRVTATGAGGCTSHQDIPVHVHDTVPPTITVIGNTNLCTGQTTSDLQADIFGATGPAQSYSWSTSETTSLITVSSGATYSLTTTDVHGCVTHNQQVITETTAPAAPIVSPVGPITLCSNDGGVTYSSATLTVQNYSSDLLWSTSETTTAITVDYGDIFNVTYTDPSGCYSVSNPVVTNAYLASTDPTSANSNAFNNNICLGSSITLSVVGGSLGDNADWQWYEGTCGTGTHLGTGASITLSPAAGLHHYFVRAEGPCNPTGTTCAPIDVTVSTAPPSGTSHFTAVTNSGCNSSSFVFSTNPVAGAAYYSWNGTSGALFNGNPGPFQTTTPSVTVTFATPPPGGTSGYSICCFSGNACGQSNTVCTWVRAKVTQPGPVIGSIIACPGTNGTYSIAPIVGADTYTWTVTGSATINGGTNTFTGSGTSITVNFLAGWTSGTLNVYASLNCGYNSPVRILAITNTTALPGTMSGPSYVCPNNSATYSVAAVPGATSYNWTCSVVGSIVTPSANSCSISFPAVIPGGSSVCVTAVSACGISGSRCKGIANGTPGTPTAISGPATGQCGQNGVSYSITPVSGATGYLWTANNGAVVSGPNNLSGVSINFPTTFSTCTLSVTAINSCGSSLARTLVVNGAPGQPGIISGNQGVCVGAVESYTTTGSAGATSYNWISPSGSTILNSPPYGASVLIQWGSTGGIVSASATNLCGTSITRFLVVGVTCRQSQVSEAMELNASLFPNPTSGMTTVKFESTTAGRYSLKVVDVMGRIIISDDMEASAGINMHEIDLSKIAKGVYLVRIESETSQVQLLKVTVE